MARRPVARPILLCCVALFVPAIAGAGTLCGTVTERQTNAPVAHAGIFLRTPSGAYTGINGATDVAGAFCIANVPAGTYDIEVRVDDEQIAYVRGVVVNATTGIAIDAAPSSLQLAAPVPNPAPGRAVLRWSMPATANVRLAIFDVHGRVVRGWAGDGLAPGAHTREWDGRDAHGRPLGSGLYFVRLDAGSVFRIRPLVLVR